VFTRMQERSRQLQLKPPADGRTLTGEVATELAADTVARALHAFRKVLKQERWSAAGGASLGTFFIGQCLFCFPNVYRRWLRETQPAPWKEVQIIEDLTETDYRYDQRHGADPIERADLRLDLRQAEQRLSEELDDRIVFILRKRDEGYTNAEVAEMLTISPRTVERLVARHRKWRQRRDEPEGEG
jgi:DNA-directed RNA polymerase specialized sigma24 family protein